MSASSQISLRGSFSSLPSGSRTIAPTDLANTTSPYQVTQLVLASGDNTISIPAGAIGCIIIFDPTSVTTKKLKGANGDTGITIKPTGWNVLSFPSSSPGPLLINSSALDGSLVTEITFF